MLGTSLRLCMFAIISCVVLFGQEFRSTLSGRITDPTGAAMPNTKVTAINNETGARSETVSTDAGEFTLPFLAPGNYRITVEATGFKRYVQERIQIGTNTRVTQDISLEVGSQTEAVTVT